MDEIIKQLEQVIELLQSETKQMRSSPEQTKLRSVAQVQRGLNLIGDGLTQLVQAQATVSAAASAALMSPPIKRPAPVPHTHEDGTVHTHD